MMRTFIKKSLTSLRLKEKGFSLIELLVVVAILGALSAVAVPATFSVIDSSRESAKASERASLQTAMDAMMAENHLTSVPAVAAATSDMTNFPSAAYKLSDYLDKDTTTYTFTCDANGRVSAAP